MVVVSLARRKARWRETEFGLRLTAIFSSEVFQRLAYFGYYRDYHAFWKLYGIGLPDPVRKKLDHANALKLTPGVSRMGFTN